MRQAGFREAGYEKAGALHALQPKAQPLFLFLATLSLSASAVHPTASIHSQTPKRFTKSSLYFQGEVNDGALQPHILLHSSQLGTTR
jgi:hypothetical protein